MTKIIHLVRHGEVYNPTGILYGTIPGFYLSDKGTHQAGLVAEWFSTKPVTYVAASPLERAQETATPIAAKHQLPLTTDRSLIEAANDFEGLKVSIGDGALKNPRYWWKLRNPFTPSWGEPYKELAQRMLTAIDRAVNAIADEEHAVLVSHQLPVWITRLHLSGQHLWHNPTKRECALASVTSVHYNSDEVYKPHSITYHEPAGSSDPRITGA